MNKLIKKLKLTPLEAVKLYDIHDKVKENDCMTTADFREMLYILPGLTSQLVRVLDMPIYKCVPFIAKGKFKYSMLIELISEYKERVGIRLL